MKRKLISIRKIKEIFPIKGADNIELAKIDGWQTVVKKGEFHKGDYGVYFEIDSFLPIEDRYEFLRKSSYKKLPNGTEGFRLKTIKLRKVLSQGLILPLSLFPEIASIDTGIDLSKRLNVTKYEAPIPAHLSGIVKGQFPSFISKSDQERIQNLPEYFEEYKDIEFEETEKLDCSSVTFYTNNEDFGVCSRNLELKESEDNTIWWLAKKLNIENTLFKLSKNIALQGEIVGEGIQKKQIEYKRT